MLGWDIKMIDSELAGQGGAHPYMTHRSCYPGNNFIIVSTHER